MAAGNRPAPRRAVADARLLLSSLPLCPSPPELPAPPSAASVCECACLSLSPNARHRVRGDVGVASCSWPHRVSTSATHTHTHTRKCTRVRLHRCVLSPFPSSVLRIWKTQKRRRVHHERLCIGAAHVRRRRPPPPCSRLAHALQPSSLSALRLPPVPEMSSPLICSPRTHLCWDSYLSTSRSSTARVRARVMTCHAQQTARTTEYNRRGHGRGGARRVDGAPSSA